MKKVKIAFVTATALLVPLISAKAADLPMEPEYKAPIVVQQVYNWTGFYIGVNGGYAWGSQDPFNLLTNRFDAFSVPFSGGVFGATAGAQIQSGHVVMGFEADIDWASINGSATVVPTIGGALPGGCGGCVASLTTKIQDVTTGRFRAGYALDNWLPYVTAGFALLGANANVSTVNGFACTTGLLTAVCTGTDHRLGIAMGAGLEYGITPALSAKFEYMYIGAASFEVSHLNEVRLGLNYRFGGL